MSSSLLVGALLNRWSYWLLLPVYCWTACRNRDILLVCERTQPSQTLLSHWSSGDANFSGVETRLSFVVETWLLIAVETRLLIAIKTRPSMRCGSWDAKIALDASRRERMCRLGRVSGFDWARDTRHISPVGRPIKDPGLLTIYLLWLFILFD